MAREEIGQPPVDSECPNLQAAALLEQGATELYNDIDYRHSFDGDPMTGAEPKAVLNAGLVGLTSARLALQALCETCPGTNSDGLCPKQPVADRILDMAGQHFGGRSIITNKVEAPGTAKSEFPEGEMTIKLTRTRK